MLRALNKKVTLVETSYIIVNARCVGNPILVVLKKKIVHPKFLLLLQDNLKLNTKNKKIKSLIELLGFKSNFSNFCPIYNTQSYKTPCILKTIKAGKMQLTRFKRYWNKLHFCHIQLCNISGSFYFSLQNK